MLYFLGPPPSWTGHHVKITRVVETVVFENGVFVSCRNLVVLTKIGKNSDSAFYPQKQGMLFLRPQKSTKMAGVTQAK